MMTFSEKSDAHKSDYKITDEIYQKNLSENKAVSSYPNLIENSTFYLENKADKLCDEYIKNVISTCKKLNYLSTEKYMTKQYRMAVSKEIPGAPVGQHCMFSQYTQLNRALYKLNEDTLNLIPNSGSKSCSALKLSMRKKYSAPEYNETIKEGHLYRTKQEFNIALKKFLEQSKNVSDYENLIKTFSAKNFIAENMHRGTILIVPQTRNSQRSFHAIVYIGRGFIDKNGSFKESKTGEFLFAANNREIIGNIFKFWNTKNVFMADIKKIAVIGFRKEFERLKNMETESLLKYVSDDTKTNSKTNHESFERDVLVVFATLKYFGLDYSNFSQELYEQKKNYMYLAQNTR